MYFNFGATAKMQKSHKYEDIHVELVLQNYAGATFFLLIISVYLNGQAWWK